VNCSEAQNSFSAWLDGEPPRSSATDDTKGHLAQCPSCARHLRQLQSTTALLRHLPATQPAAAARGLLTNALRTTQPVAQLRCADCSALLLDSADAALPLDDHEAVAVHLANCVPCNQVAAALQTQQHLLQAVPAVSPPQGLKSAILARVRAEERAAAQQLTCEQAAPLLSARLEGESSAELEVHLANCASCARSALALEDQRDLLRSLPAALPPPDLPEQIYARIATYQRSALLLLITAMRRSRHLALAAGVAACAIAFAGIGYLSQRQPQSLEVAVAPAPASPLVATPRSPAPVSSVVASSPAAEPIAGRTEPASPAESAGLERSLPLRLASARPAPAPTTKVARGISPGEARTSAAPEKPTTSPPPVAAKAVAEPARTGAGPHSDRPLRDLEALYAELARSRAATRPVAEPVSPAATEAPMRRVAQTVFVDDSPANAPSPSDFSAPSATRPTVRTAELQVEAPPVNPRIVRRDQSTAEKDTLVELRERLRKNRAAKARSTFVETESSKTAKYTLVEVPF